MNGVIEDHMQTPVQDTRTDRRLDRTPQVGRHRSQPAVGPGRGPEPRLRRPVIEMKGVTKRFGDSVAVEDLTFNVHEGEIFGFIGPSGSGKTTTIRLMNGTYNQPRARQRSSVSRRTT